MRLPEKPGEAVAALAELSRADIYNVQSFMSDEVISMFYAARGVDRFPRLRWFRSVNRFD